MPARPASHHTLLHPIHHTLPIRNRHLQLLLLLILILPSSSLCTSNTSFSSSTPPPPTAPSFTPLLYIVSFHAYLPHFHHESSLRLALRLTPPSAWRILPRPNIAASTLPTDFLLLETPDTAIIATLQAHPTIYRVTPQTEHIRHPLAIRLPAEFEDEDNGDTHNRTSPSSPSSSSSSQPNGRRDPLSVASTLGKPALHPFGSGALWRRGVTGRGVSVAVFDTGLLPDHRYFPTLASQTDWTGENTTHDHVGHGTFVAGLIAGRHPACPGLAPDVLLHVFRVFTAAQVSYTSWFLDAFNYAMHIGVDVLNLSIGGPDFADNPFTEKIDELAAHGVIAVSAIGNDGPLWGSLNNPGDMMPVVGVGGAEPSGSVASFSSRGMTTHELDHRHHGYGRVKPDVVAYARSLVGPSHRSADRCKRLSGTSVASPVVAGAIALLASTVPKERRRRVVTPASVKKALVESARQLAVASMYEQGAGLLDVADAFERMVGIDEEFVKSEGRTGGGNFGGLDFASRLLSSWRSHGTSNMSLADRDGEDEKDEREESEDDYHRISSQRQRRLRSVDGPSLNDIRPGPRAAFFPSYYDLRTAKCAHMWPHCAQPLYEGALPVNLNVTILNPGGVEGRVESIVWVPGRNGDFLNVVVTPPHRFWPWSAGMGVHISATGKTDVEISAEGVIKVRVVSVREKTYSDIELPIMANVVAPPSKEKRLLWDMYHSVRYPPGYVPRDNLAETKDMLDWLGDHPHTNFHSLFREFRLAGFFVDTLDQPLSCLGEERARKYGAIIVLDTEDFFSTNDTVLLESLVKEHGLSLIVAAEWFSLLAMEAIRFEDDNTRSWWSPVIGGGNVPALNELLRVFGIGLGAQALSGDVQLGSHGFRFESGVPIVKFPAGGELVFARFMTRFEAGLKGPKRQGAESISGGDVIPNVPVLGLTKMGNGAVLAYGDTNCIDTAYSGGKCHAFFVEAVRHAINQCAGQAECRRMLQRSMIVEKGLEPGSDGNVQALAGSLPEAILNVFKPHSKYELRYEKGCGVECKVEGLVDSVEECRNRKALQTTPKVERLGGSVWSAVELPEQRQAEPLGSESKYYGEVEGKGWWGDWQTRRRTDSAGSDASSHDSSRVEGSVVVKDDMKNLSVASNVDGGRRSSKWLPGSRWRSVWLMLVGLGMMIASISLRRIGVYRRSALWRKYGKGRLAASGTGVGAGSPSGWKSRGGSSSGHSVSNFIVRSSSSHGSFSLRRA